MATEADTADADAPDRIPTPQLTDHALARYDARAPAGAIAPEAALAAATPDDGIVAHPRFGSPETPTPDRVWVYTDVADGRLWTMTFIEVGESVVTSGTVDMGVAWETADESGTAEAQIRPESIRTATKTGGQNRTAVPIPSPLVTDRKHKSVPEILVTIVSLRKIPFRWHSYR